MKNINNRFDRKAKIAFLKGLIKGERNLWEIAELPPPNVFHYNPEDKTYYSRKLDKTFTEEEFEKRRKKRKNYGDYITDIIIHHIIIDGVDTAKKIRGLAE